ncbi:hypothetical protein [Nafulsella turpanensis]|uniref:hypothetical protein n=1 Tax=Nafulsella turpanensis TaxID=1265690 RepID=UPI000475654C|nr:hypothetical protein [Nafulsella turpanensis]
MKLTLLLIFLLSIQSATACDCGTTPTIAESHQSSDLIFVGEVLSIEPFDLTEIKRLDELPQLYSKQVIRFKISQIIKGNPASEVAIITGLGDGDCGFGFKKGVSYLVYAHEDGLFTEKDDKHFETDICDRTKIYPGPNAELERLLELRHKHPPNLLPLGPIASFLQGRCLPLRLS